MTDTLIKHVSDTAFWVANYRAIETARPDALFRDPLAGRLAGEHGKNISTTMPLSFMTAWTVVIRTCIIDNYIKFAIKQGADTVLNLGAGLDTRPYRMEVPKSLRWIEVDYPHVIEFKEKQLSGETPRCDLERVPLDLADREARRKFFSSVSSRTGRIVVLTEGVVPYLDIEEVASLADDLGAMSNVAFWIIDYFSREALRYRQRGPTKTLMKNAPFKFDPEDWFGFFQGHGWQAKEIRYLVDEGELLHRPMPLHWFLRIALPILRWITPKGRIDTFRKFAGYVLLEPAPS